MYESASFLHNYCLILVSPWFANIRNNPTSDPCNYACHHNFSLGHMPSNVLLHCLILLYIIDNGVISTSWEHSGSQQAKSSDLSLVLLSLICLLAKASQYQLLVFMLLFSPFADNNVQILHLEGVHRIHDPLNYELLARYGISTTVGWG